MHKKHKKTKKKNHVAELAFKACSITSTEKLDSDRNSDVSISAISSKNFIGMQRWSIMNHRKAAIWVVTTSFCNCCARTLKIGCRTKAYSPLSVIGSFCSAISFIKLVLQAVAFSRILASTSIA